VRDGIGESFQFFVGGFELGGAFADALLEFFIEFSDFWLRRAFARHSRREGGGPLGDFVFQLFVEPGPRHHALGPTRHFFEPLLRRWRAAG